MAQLNQPDGAWEREFGAVTAFWPGCNLGGLYGGAWYTTLAGGNGGCQVADGSADIEMLFEVRGAGEANRSVPAVLVRRRERRL